jgi:hypothetical protein
MLGLLFCAPTDDETDFRVGENKISYFLSLFNQKSTKAQKRREESKKTCYSIYISSFIPIIFLIHRSWFRFEGPQNCVSPICSHSDNHRSRITSGLPCQLWLIRFHHWTQVNLSHHSSSSSFLRPFVRQTSFPLLASKIYLVENHSPQSTKDRDRRAKKDARRATRDGASANPIENYLLFVILITSFSHNRIKGSSEVVSSSSALEC